MDIQLITIVLTSSVLSAALTAIVNWFIQGRNYRNEYFKKLLDKRLLAYEEVEIMISNMQNMVAIGEGQGKLCNEFLFHGTEYFYKYLASIRIPIERALWLSAGLSGLLTEYNTFLINEIENRVDNNGNEDEQLVEIGCCKQKDIRAFRLKIQKQLYTDLSEMHQVRKFIKSLRFEKDRLKYLVYEKPDHFIKKGIPPKGPDI